MSTAEQPYQQIGIQSNSGGDINIEQSQVNIAGRDLHIQMLSTAQERELRNLAVRLTAFRLLEDDWLEATGQSVQNVRFYQGFRATWSDLLRDLDVRREQFPELLRLSVEKAGYRALIAIISEMGAGKTTVLKRLALELHRAGSLVLYHKEDVKNLSADEIRQFADELRDENISRPIYLCIDDAARITNLAEFVSRLAEEGIKAVAVLASRTSDWRDTNLAFTANLDDDPVEFPLSQHLSLREVKDLSSKLHRYQTHPKPLKFNSRKSILIMMMEASGGRGFHEIIKERLQRLGKKGGKLLTVYEYTCLLGQFGLSMPIRVLQKLFPEIDILTDVLRHSFFREIIEYTDDGQRITPGHEVVAHSVIKQQYGVGPSSLIVLVGMFARLIEAIPHDLSLLVVNLLLGLVGQDSKLANEVMLRSEFTLAELIQKSSAADLSKGWAKVYEVTGNYKLAQECHLKSLELEEDSYALARYSWFLRRRNRFLEARRYLERTTAIVPDDAVAYSMLGRLLMSMLLYEAAAEKFEIALRINPSYISTLFPIYLPVLLYLTRYERAEELCRLYLAKQNLKPETRQVLQMMHIGILVLCNNISAAENEIKTLVASSPDSLPRVTEIFTKRFQRKSNLSREQIIKIQTLFDRYLPQVKSDSSAQTPGIPDELPGDGTLPVNGTSSVTVLSESDLLDKKLIGEVEPKVSEQVIEATLKQLRESGQPEAIPTYLGSITQQDQWKWNTLAHLEYAKYLEAQGKLTEAEDHFITAVVYKNPTQFKAPLQYACFLAEHDRVEEARNYFQHALATPDLPLKRFTQEAVSYVWALIASNNVQEAITTCEQYTIALSDEQRMRLVDTLMDNNRYEDLEHFARTRWETTTSKKKSEMVAALIIALVRQGRYQEALLYKGFILKKYPISGIKQMRALAECGVYLVRQHAYKDDIQYIDIAMRRVPDNPYVLSAQIEWLITTRKFTKADQIVRRLLSSNPDFCLAHALRGQLLSWQGHTHQAYLAFERAVSMQKQDSEALAKYCYFLINESRLLADVDSYESTVLLNLALEQGQAAYQLEATNPYVVNNYAHALSLAGELEQADIIVQHMLKRSPSDGSTLIQAGEIKASKGQSSDAVKCYEIAISTASPFFRTRAHIGMARLLLSTGDALGAYEYLHKTLEPSKSGSQVKLAMAESLVSIGRLDLAEVLFRQIITRRPGFVEARLGLADLLVNIGQTAQALAAYTLFAIECWEVGRVLAIVRIGHTTLHLLNSLLDDKLQIVALTTGLLAGRAACLNPYTQQTANRILRDVSNWLTAHPKAKELLENQITDLEVLLQPVRIAKADESPATNNHEKILIQFLRSSLKSLASDNILMGLEENSASKEE